MSHWPGNDTPAALKHDLSTGIALTFSRLPAAEQRALVGDFEVVANNHYDTDGALSAFAVLRPEEALPRAEALLAAAATGDFSVWRGPAALAVDLGVMTLTRHPASPLASRLAPGLSDEQRWAAGYAWLLEHLSEVLDDPFALREQWAERHQQVVEDVRRIEAGTGISVRRFPEEELALVSSDRPVTSIGMNLAAGDCFRVLLVRASRGGFRYRFVYRVESWFELASRRPLPRASLLPALAALQRAEPGPAGGPPPDQRWWCTDERQPVAELGFGRPPAEDASLFGDPDIEADPETRLPPSTVLDALRAAFRATR